MIDLVRFAEPPESLHHEATKGRPEHEDHEEQIKDRTGTVVGQEREERISAGLRGCLPLSSFFVTFVTFVVEAVLAVPAVSYPGSGQAFLTHLGRFAERLQAFTTKPRRNTKLTKSTALSGAERNA